MSTVPRKQSVILGGQKYPLVYLTIPTYKELLEKVEKYAQKVVMRTQGHDEKDPYRSITIEIKGFVFNGCVFTEETNVLPTQT
jgi:hypothetical protein